MRSAPSTSTDAAIMPEAPLALPTSSRPARRPWLSRKRPVDPVAARRSRCAPEYELRRTDGDSVVVLELRALLAAPVDGHAVRRSEVEDPVGLAFAAELRMAPGDVRIGEPDVAVLRAADDDAALVDPVLLPVRVERDHLRLDSELLGGRGLGHGARGAVDH